MGRETPKKIKPFYKITFEDIDFAAEFFDNEKHLSEFLLATISYYKGEEPKLKTKIVARYFQNYKKTMDMIIAAKKYGSDGGLKSAENKQVKETTLVGGVQEGVKEGVVPNNKVLNIKDKEVNINHKANEYINHYNTIFSKKYKVTDGIKKALENWLKVYTLDEIKTAVNRASFLNTFEANLAKEEPIKLLRSKNANGDVDYIGSILNSIDKKPTSTPNVIRGIL